MYMVDIYALAIKLLKKTDAECPGKVFKNRDGTKVKIQDVIANLSQMKNWLYPALRTEDITKVVRCKNCRYYKKYRKKGVVPAVVFQACSLDKKPRDPMFFCKDGDEA